MGKDNQPTTIRLPNKVRIAVHKDAIKEGLPLATKIKQIVCAKYPNTE